MVNKPLDNHYETLCLSSSATADEIRRAYRVLARRYHPDVNPGKASEEKFKAIAAAYSILGDPQQRAHYDAELQEQLRGGVTEKIREYQRRQTQGERMAARQRYYQDIERRRQAHLQAQAQRAHALHAARAAASPFAGIRRSFDTIKKSVLAAVRPLPMGGKRVITPTETSSAVEVQKISIIEVSVSMRDAIRGVKKTVEIAQPEGTRKVSVIIPAGVRTGTVLRFRDKGGSGEELVFILRVAAHPFLSIENKGLVVEVPISVGEALAGANVTLPTLDDTIVMRVPAGTQSGTEIRAKGRGIVGRDGTQGDLFYRMMIVIPDAVHAVGLREKAAEMEAYYPGSVRQNFAKSLLEME